jgi:alginate O-acetyltransferase complex protein AlgJ
VSAPVPRRELSSMPIVRRAPLLVAAVVLAGSAATGVASAVSSGDAARPGHQGRSLTTLERPAERALRAAVTANHRDGEPPTTYVGLDGLIHVVAPNAVLGKSGYYYIGSDFDTACAFGPLLHKAMKRLSRLADIFEKAGKQVFFTVTPNKSAVVRSDLPDPVPQGACSRRGLRVQAKLLDSYRDSRYLPLRGALTKVRHPFWRTDTHWDTVGASVFAEHLAAALDPDLARQQRYRRTTRTQLGDLARYVPGLLAETAPARLPDNGVSTKAAQGSESYDPSLASVYTDLSWRSRPARKTYAGRTLILGDSFTYTAFESLANLFQRGRFLWVGTQDSMGELATAVKKADTVVFTVVQRFATVTQLVDPTFQRNLKAALR